MCYYLSIVRPVELVLQESGSSLKLTFQYPLHAQGFQHFFISTKSQRDQDWVKEFPGMSLLFVLASVDRYKYSLPTYQ